MNPHSLIDQLEILVRNGAPLARIQSVLVDLRAQVSLLERLLDTPLEMSLSPPEGVTDENVAAVPVWDATLVEEPKIETSAIAPDVLPETLAVEPPPPGNGGDE